jgi:hypothetical protein
MKGRGLQDFGLSPFEDVGSGNYFSLVGTQ